MYKCSLTVRDDYAGNHLLPAAMHDPAGNGPVPATLCMDCRKIFFCEKIQNYAIERFVVSPCRKTVGHTFQGARFDRLSVPPNQQAQGPDPTKKLSVPLIPTGSETALFVLRWRRWRVAPEVVVARIAPNNTNRQIWQIPENTRSVFYFFSYFRQICRIPPLLETVSQFIFLSFRQKGEIFRHILIAAGELHLHIIQKIEPSLVFAFSLNSSDYS